MPVRNRWEAPVAAAAPGLRRRRHGRWRRRRLHVEHVRRHRRCPCRELALRSILREVARRRPRRSGPMGGGADGASVPARRRSRSGAAATAEPTGVEMPEAAVTSGAAATGAAVAAAATGAAVAVVETGAAAEMVVAVATGNDRHTLMSRPRPRPPVRGRRGRFLHPPTPGQRDSLIFTFLYQQS